MSPGTISMPSSTQYIVILLLFFATATRALVPTKVLVERATQTVGIPIAPGYMFTSGVPGCTSGSTTNGSFKYTWSSSVNPTGMCGKGWMPGTNRTIGYSGTFSPNGNGKLAIYGWTRSPLIEYNIVESYGTYNPASGASKKGTASCNSRVYDILQTTRVNQPSIDGTQTFQQFWSVLQTAQVTGSVSGTVDMACHFEAWASLGMNIGTAHDYQIVEVDSYYSSGTATITVANYTVPS